MNALAPMHTEMADPAPVRLVPDLRLVEPQPFVRSGYRPSRRSAPAALAASLAIVGTLGSAFVLLGGPAIIHKQPKPLVVTMHLLPPPPPPEAQPDTPPPPPAAPVLTAPTPLVKTPTPPVLTAPPPIESPAPPVVTAATTPAVAAPAAPPAPPAPAPAPAGPVDGGDLSVNMLSATPPSYPIESRRKKEQGTVRLSVLVGTDGRVADIGLAGSSGSERLDKAALQAVRRWRWSPLKRAGLAVMVRGIVTIPFVLRT